MRGLAVLLIALQKGQSNRKSHLPGYADSNAVECALTYGQLLASIRHSASVDRSRRYDFRPLLRNRSAMAGAAIHRMDVDDHRLFKTRYVVPGDCANVRWRASMFSLSRG